MNKQQCLVAECRHEYTHIVAEYPWLVCKKHTATRTKMCPRYKNPRERKLANATR